MLKQKILAIGTALLLTFSLAGCGGESTLGDIYDGLSDIPVEDIMDGASGLLDGAIQDATDAWNEGRGNLKFIILTAHCFDKD